jgi:hypothetical protein
MPDREPTQWPGNAFPIGLSRNISTDLLVQRATASVCCTDVSATMA